MNKEVLETFAVILIDIKDLIEEMEGSIFYELSNGDEAVLLDDIEDA